jgi:hypothetical protein
VILVVYDVIHHLCTCHLVCCDPSTHKKIYRWNTLPRDEIFQSAEIFASEHISSFLERASTNAIFFPFTYSISNSYSCNFLTHFCFLSFKSFYPRKCLKLLWLILTTNFPPTKYCLNFTKECMMESISLSYMEYSISKTMSFLLSYAIGCRYCIITAPIPSPDASHSSKKGRVKSGSVKTGQVPITSFILSNVLWASSIHLNAHLFMRYVSVAPNYENPFTKCR